MKKTNLIVWVIIPLIAIGAFAYFEITGTRQYKVASTTIGPPEQDFLEKAPGSAHPVPPPPPPPPPPPAAMDTSKAEPASAEDKKEYKRESIKIKLNKNNDEYVRAESKKVINANRSPASEHDIVENSTNNIAAPNPTLAYQYPTEIHQEETGRYIYVHVDIKDASAVVGELKKDIVDFKQGGLNKADTVNIITTYIKPYKFITVTVENTNPAVIVDNTSDQSARQEINTEEGNKWKWQVRTDTGTGTVRLVLHVKGELPDGKNEIITDREIPIKIKILNPVPGMWSWLAHNPKSFLTLLIIPVVKELWKLFKGKKG